MFDLENYKLPMKPTASRIYDAVSSGVKHSEFPDVVEAKGFLGDLKFPVDKVRRAQDGRVLITSVTDMAEVTPTMIDWWFGWHLPSTERYRLWHPKAHISARVKEDRSNIKFDRARCIHNVSYVDEYIGSTVKKLVIEFVPPDELGISGLEHEGSTAVCAHTTDRVTNGRGGCVIHYVMPTDQGSQMRSAFWLGDIVHKVGVIDRLFHGILNSKFFRKVVISDQMALDLLLHCGEEMQHLATFLPKLYEDAHANGVA
jgi:hypothetical protein